MEKQKCIICRKNHSNGIIINGRFICNTCEARLINSNIETDFYKYYIECMKKIIMELMLRERTSKYESFYR
ncbi:sigma factor G inhibitor Gin [Clostridium sp. 19966]|uniref:sigma factor G inhibitor Gin n=1 Tax=Clostridium sp. 19966 TaxID=2768166 RepID=UPI0028E00CB2|nr:sigma factor G inhibitor Gin [Clostridium sp. 19966]MDT8715775.1 sigma factor G inhibitor Gin [Clostridium sp. 19966]